MFPKTPPQRTHPTPKKRGGRHSSERIADLSESDVVFDALDEEGREILKQLFLRGDNREFFRLMSPMDNYAP